MKHVPSNQILLTRKETQEYIDLMKQGLLKFCTPEQAMVYIEEMEKLHNDMWAGRIPGITPFVLH